MQLKDFSDQNFIPELGIYSSSNWFIGIKGHLQTILLALHGERYLQYNYKPSMSQADNMTAAYDQLKNKIGSLFLLKMKSYEDMFNTLTAEYNPIWNYDGENTLTYTKANTGTSNHATTNTGTSNHSYSNTGTSNHSYSNTGTQQVDDTLSDTVTHSQTTYDSGVEQETGQDASQHGGYTKRTDNLAATDNRTDNLAATDNRTDNLAGSDNRTDNLQETYSHTEIKHGNQGTTTTQSMILEEIALRQAYNFIELVCNDIANFVSY